MGCCPLSTTHEPGGTTLLPGPSLPGFLSKVYSSANLVSCSSRHLEYLSLEIIILLSWPTQLKTQGYLVISYPRPAPLSEIISLSVHVTTFKNYLFSWTLGP